MSERVRIGIIGAGGNTRTRHIPGFQAIPGVEVVAVCNRTKASGEKVAREFAIPRVAESWKEIVDAPDIDAICIGTWPNILLGTDSNLGNPEPAPGVQANQLPRQFSDARGWFVFRDLGPRDDYTVSASKPGTPGSTRRSTRPSATTSATARSASATGPIGAA